MQARQQIPKEYHSYTNFSEGWQVGGGAYTAVAVAKKTGTGSWVVYHIFRDHLGTITHLKNGSTIDEYSFDSWGRRRDKDTWSYTLSGEPALFADRGFTGHEYLEDFNLYNMNGRLYDPVLGRFLSPDPIVQNPAYTQNLNRYSYVLNNPLRYNDPTGYRIRITPGEDETYINHDALRYIGGGRLGLGSGNHWSDSFNMSMGNFHIFSASTLGLQIGTDTRTVDFGMRNGVPGYFFNYVSVSPQRRIGSPGSEDFRATFEVEYVRRFIAQGQGGMPGWATDVNTGIGAFNAANGLKSELI